MSDFVHKPENPGRTLLDDQLDAALPKYSAVEPRAGLEKRILAALKAEQRSPAAVGSRPWAAAVAALAMLTGFLIWRLANPGREQVVHRPPTPQQEVSPPVEANSHRDVLEHAPSRPVWSARTHVSSAPAIAAAVVPRLDQFPSPRPLSEQEKMLLDYVGQYPAEAALVAKAQTELLDREEKEKAEKYGLPPAGAEPQNRQHFESPNL